MNTPAQCSAKPTWPWVVVGLGYFLPCLIGICVWFYLQVVGIPGFKPMPLRWILDVIPILVIFSFLWVLPFVAAAIVADRLPLAQSKYRGLVYGAFFGTALFEVLFFSDFWTNVETIFMGGFLVLPVLTFAGTLLGALFGLLVGWTDSAVQLRARRISALIMTTGVVGPSLGVFAGRIAGTGSIFRGPGPIVYLSYVTPAVVFAALPFVGLAVLTRRSVCKQGRWSAFWIGAFVSGLVVSILMFAVLVSDLEILVLGMLGGPKLQIIISLSLVMLLGGAIGWILGRAISWFRQPAA